MSERTIRSLAKELAGTFYEMKRTDRFRSKDSMTWAKTLKHNETGQLVEVTELVKFTDAYPNAHKFSVAHWPFFYDTARQCLVGMLGQPDTVVHPNLKRSIYDAIIEDREKQMKQGGKSLVQRRMEGP